MPKMMVAEKNRVVVDIVVGKMNCSLKYFIYGSLTSFIELDAISNSPV